MLSRHKRGLSLQMKRELKRRLVIEAAIGYMKTDGRLGRNFLASRQKAIGNIVGLRRHDC